MTGCLVWRRGALPCSMRWKSMGGNVPGEACNADRAIPAGRLPPHAIRLHRAPIAHREGKLTDYGRTPTAREQREWHMHGGVVLYECLTGGTS
jgi:hypothetical protein